MPGQPGISYSRGETVYTFVSKTNGISHKGSIPFESTRLADAPCRRLCFIRFFVYCFMKKRTHYKYTKELLEPIVKNSISIAQVLLALKLKYAGGSYRHISKIIKEFEISTTHFKRQGWNKGLPSLNRHTKESAFKKIFILNGSKTRGVILKRLLLELDIKKEICETCKIDPVWNNQPLSLHVHHINGNHFDNRLENLQILCPNCHTQTPTYGSKIRK